MHKFFVLFTLLAAALSARAQERYVVLVPGFFNLPSRTAGVLPKYFGDGVLQTLRAHGLKPIVVDDMDPIGTLEENGTRLQNDFEALARQYPGAQFDVIAHSAGGLYVAEALTRDPSLPLRHVITTCTPYGGAELVDLVRGIPGFGILTNLLDLSALREFERANMPSLLARLQRPRRVRWTALAAAQPVCNFGSCAQADHLSWLLSLAWRLTRDDGDGVVSVASAEARGLGLDVETWPDYVIPLEHWEVVLDAGWFSALGVQNPDWIRQRQIELYTKIAKAL